MKHEAHSITFGFHFIEREREREIERENEKFKKSHEIVIFFLPKDGQNQYNPKDLMMAYPYKMTLVW